MLTLFSHLQLSVIDEMPAGRKEIKTWLISEKKRENSLKWIAETLKNEGPAQALVVCPFIDQSEAEGLDKIAAATETFATLKKFYKGQKLKIALLHGRMKKPDQTEVTDALYKKEIDLLVTTPIVEVGVDLPAASIIVIEAAERFGLASLHQLRGRVGRAGQQAYCLLFTNSKSAETKGRLLKFCDIHNGLELAELDLQRRGAGDLFGTQQHGLDQLQFAEWTNLNLVTLAKQVSDQLTKQKIPIKPFIEIIKKSEDEIPLAN
jgi:ATP-dependent DNA helicase RecG